MPRTNTKSLNTNVTPDEYDFIRDVLANGDGIAAYLRQLIKRDAAQRGYTYPDKTIPRGQYPRYQQCPHCGGWNVGEMDGTKACADCG